MRRYVITGGPCCGKSSLIDLFESKGLSTLSETAREVLENKGNESYHEMQLKLFTKQLEKEEPNGDGRVFLDRSAVDSIAYCNLYLGYIPQEIQDFNLRNRYDRVFIPDRLPFKPDSERVESGDEEAQRIHEEIHRVYKSFGYDPIPIPVISIKERGEFILGRI